MNHEDGGRGLMSIIVRIAGLFLLVIGLIVALLTIREALQLYNNPARVERFALAIEKGSNIDRSINSFRSSNTGETQEEGAPPSAGNKRLQEALPESNDIRVSYFLSWVIVLLLLLLLARIALATIKTGGELVLHDTQIKQFARMLLKESGNAAKR